MKITINLLRLLSTVVLLASSVHAQVKIEEIGLSGYVAANSPARVRLKVINPSTGGGSFTLRLQRLSTFNEVTLEYESSTSRVNLGPGETRSIDVPFFFADAGTLRAQLVDTSGHELGSDQREFWNSGTGLIVILCKAEEICNQTAQSLRRARTIQERNRREQSLHILILQQPPAVWYAYAPVSRIVLAMPISDPTAREALADYVRLGGKITTLLDRAPDFLFEYRIPGRTITRVGKGELRIVANAQAPELQDMLADSGEAVFSPAALTITSSFNTNWLIDWVGTHFVFPKMSGLLLWAAVYILVVGFVNFWVLRRLKRVEMGWYTIPAIALLFAIGFYFFSARGRLSQFVVDEATICTMDDIDSHGAIEAMVRVASPEVRKVSLQMPLTAVLSSVDYDPMFRASDLAGAWSERRSRRADRVPPMEADTSQHVNLEMLRLSFRDLAYKSIRVFPGSVRLENGKLRNFSGQNFSEAILADLARHRYWTVGALPNGGESRAYAGRAEEMPTATGYVPNPGIDFSLGGLMQGWRFSSDEYRGNLLFIGRTDVPLLGGRLQGIEAVRRAHTIFVVRLRNK